MDLSAILVTAERSLAESANNLQVLLGSQQSRREVALANVEVFGQSVLERTVIRLHRAGVRLISLITSRRFHDLSNLGDVRLTIVEEQNDRWAAAERVLGEHAQLGVRTALLGEIGAYVELDLAKTLAFHLAQQQPLTPLHDKAGTLNHWIVEAGQIASNRNSGLPFHQDEFATNARPYLVSEHVNRMRDAQDLRRLVVDAFLGRCSIALPGQQIKPGVWIDDGVRVHKSARLVPPVYLGRGTCVHSASLVTKFSNLERRCQLGEGSVVANASILPHTIVGSGLDITTAVVSGDELVDLRRNLTLKIHDPNLISDAAGRHARIAGHSTEFEACRQSGRVTRTPQPEYSGYLSRAAGRLMEVFRDEV